ncbi:Regulator of nonsense transcripts 2 [Zalerion maritima]|uniref:Regulator of nonsense transcripts 2 n=1 Tax=Zalerion maritima TaxID=339359 RepID=A0AAD5RUA3_9PEZI|nr:Regulator of nonsense transcripts 2 [Zalerion maritima]
MPLPSPRTASSSIAKNFYIVAGELRELNERVWDGEIDLFSVNKSLDSSLRKNTAFIKRLRTAVSAATLNTFLQEIRTLSLHRYLSEIISACYEGLCKLKSPGDVEAGVEIVSALHQRFGADEFTENLAWLLGKGMATPEKSVLKALPAEAREKEEKDRVVRQRVLLRVVTELWLVGVLRTLDDARRPDEATKGATGKVPELKPRTSNLGKGGAEPFPLEVLKDLLGHDREHANLPLLVTFVKTFGWDILGVNLTGGDGRKGVDEDGATKTVNGDSSSNYKIDDSCDDSAFTSPDLQQRFKNILKRYFDDVANHILRDQKAIASQHRRNAEAYVRSGEVFEDRQANYEKQVKNQERLIANAQVLADAVGADMPNTKEDGDSTSSANGSIGLVKTGEYLRGQSDGAGIWEDEEERRFYENLVDLKGKVPVILLEDAKKKKSEPDEPVGKRNDAPDVPEPPKNSDPVEEQSTSIANKSVGAKVDAILGQLADLTHKDTVDQTAIDFCFLNSKASRNRLVKGLQDVPKGRGDLLPFWSRLVATLGRYMPDIPKGVVEYLDAEFRSLQRRKDKDFLGQVRLVNIRYLAELTKFGIVPEHVVFHCLKVSLDDFSRMNIEIICDLLENCGRYLLRNPETSPRMASFLETLQRKKTAQIIGQQERMLIENAIYYVDPPERPAIQQKDRTPMELFIRKLVYMDLTKRNYPKILKQIRRLHWEEPEVVDILMRVFSKPGKVKYGNIHLLAILLGALYKYHQVFAVRVVDTVLESIALGLEQNDFRFNQRRIAEIKYLAELYNYRMLDHPVIFDTLYRIMTFGHNGAPVPGRVNLLDQPDDFFRIRLAATILETCGMYFNKGAAGKKLDYFLSFFQYYIYTKNALPMDIEFTVHDVFEGTRRQWKLASNLEEAAKAFQLAVSQDQKTAGIDKTVEPDDVTSGASSDDGDGDGDGDDGDEDESESVSEEVEDGEEQDSSDEASMDEEIVVTREEEMVDPEAEAEFEHEYAKLMAESLESRKLERKPIFDVPIPVMAKNRESQSSQETETGAGPSAPTMAFALLTKKGNRQQTKTVELPSNSTFAVAMRNSQQAEREEQQRIKNLVLNYDMRENDDVDGDSTHTLLDGNLNVYTCAGNDRPSSFFHNRLERPSKDRGGQRVRKLQLSDVDWYGKTEKDNPGPGADLPPPGSSREAGTDQGALSNGDRNNKRLFAPQTRSGNRNQKKRIQFA